MPVSKNVIKYIQSFRQKKFRQKYNKFVVEGDKMVRELLEYRPDWVESLFALPEWMVRWPSQKWPAGLEVVTVSNHELSRLSLLKTPNQALALVQQPHYELKAVKLDTQLTLFLDDLQDPGNMGTLLRLADWFGISTVICSPNCVEVFNPKVIQASMGAFLRVQTLTADFEAVINQVPEITVFGADMEGQNVFQADLPETGVLVIGNEGAGITPAIMEKVTHRVSIPKGAGGGAESLNAAVAAGIIIGVLGNQG
jgi:TrmH family RNA methyltransferase